MKQRVVYEIHRPVDHVSWFFQFKPELSSKIAGFKLLLFRNVPIVAGSYQKLDSIKQCLW